MKSKVVDMTEGNVLKLIVTFMIPMLIGNLFQQFYNMVDTMIVGRYVGPDALAAVGATASMNFLFISLCIGLANGIGVVVAQYFGAGMNAEAKNSIGNAVYIMGVSGVVMAMLGVVFANRVLRFLKTPDNILADATVYMQIMCFGIIFVSFYNCICSILRAVGDSKTPLYFLIISSFMNIFLDLLFVRKFGWGCAGAGIATVASQLLAGLGSFVFAVTHNEYFKLNKSDIAVNKSIIKRCVRIGVPLAFQSSLISISCVALQSVVNTFGSTVIAAFTATSRIEQLVQQPFNSLGMSLSTFTGQNIGANKIDRVKKGFRYALLIMLAYALIICVPMAVFAGDKLMGFFVNDAAVIQFGAKALRITCIFYIFLGCIYVCRGALNGAGDATFSFINGLVEVAGRICFAKPFTMIPGVGVWGVWLATAMTWFVTGIVSMIRFMHGKWKNRVI